MTPDHKNIAERFERRTYIKGTFKGTFTGQIDPGTSDNKTGRFYDLEIIEGNITTTQDNMSKWPFNSEPAEFVTVSRFPARSGEVRVTLQYLDGSVKYFKIRLQELKLINCSLSKQANKDNRVTGAIEGEISDYVLHYDSTNEEIIEIKAAPVHVDNKEHDLKEEKQPYAFVKKPAGYFAPGNRQLHEPDKKNGLLAIFSCLFWAALTLGLFVIIHNIVLAIVFMVIGLLLLSGIYKWLAGQFSLYMSVRSVTVLYCTLFFSAIVLLVWSALGDKKDKIIAENIFQDPQNPYTIHQPNKDSFNHYFEAGKTSESLHNYESALKDFQHAEVFAPAEDSKLLTVERAGALKLYAFELVKQAKYTEAASAYSQIIALTGGDAEAFYKRAQCYDANGKSQQAVTDLKKAMALGDKAAMLLHDKINPPKKRLIDIVTLCKDGTYSHAKGRGACSSHDGVKEWDHKVYEEYREYK